MKALKIAKNEKGQGVMEYIILSSLVGIFCLVAVSQFGNVLQKRIQNMREMIVKEIPLK
jgi:hypothetical protein